MTEIDFTINKKIDLTEISSFQYQTYETDGEGEGIILTTREDFLKNFEKLDFVTLNTMPNIISSVMNIALNDDIYIEGYAVDLGAKLYAEFVFCKSFSEFLLYDMPSKGSAESEFVGVVKDYLKTIDWFE